MLTGFVLDELLSSIFTTSFPAMAPLELAKAPLICLPNNPTIKMAAMAIIPRMMRYSVMLKPQRVCLKPKNFIMINSFFPLKNR
jgi:hypothetical protein